MAKIGCEAHYCNDGLLFRRIVTNISLILHFTSILISDKIAFLSPFPDNQTIEVINLQSFSLRITCKNSIRNFISV